MRTRDPEARRRALCAAVIETIAEVGIGRTTHRAVAARAGLPLGATTYYFPTLDDLIAAGLRQAVTTLEADLATWAARLDDSDDLPATLADLINEDLTDRRQVRIEYELYVAAARDHALRPLAEAWLHGMRAVLHPRIGDTAAHDVIAYLDGIMLQALVTGLDISPAAVADAIRRLT